MYNYEIFIRLVYELILNEGDVAVDVGAHSGLHTIPMAQCVKPNGKVLAFEPLPAYTDAIKKKAKDDFPDLCDVIVFYSCALSDREGSSDFIFAVDAPEYSGLRKRYYDIPTRTKKITVEMKTLDSLCNGLECVNFIKIDAEGGEYDIIKGGESVIQKYKPIVLFEFGNNSIEEYDVTPVSMYNFWERNEYTIYNIKGVIFHNVADFERSASLQEVWDYVAISNTDTLNSYLISKFLKICARIVDGGFLPPLGVTIQ